MTYQGIIAAAAARAVAPRLALLLRREGQRALVIGGSVVRGTDRRALLWT